MPWKTAATSRWPSMLKAVSTTTLAMATTKPVRTNALRRSARTIVTSAAVPLARMYIAGSRPSRFAIPATAASDTAIAAPAEPPSRMPMRRTAALVGTTYVHSVRSAATRIAMALPMKASRNRSSERLRCQISGSKRHR